MIHQPNSGVIIGGRYRIANYLGGGGFGQTYLAEDIHLPSTPACVVKHLKPRLSDSLSLDTAQRLFETEAQVLYKLNEYNQIPRLLAHFEENQEFYLVQEYIEGDNLSRELVLGKHFNEKQAIALLRDILQVLVFIHQHNVIHRDLKPSNLIRRKRDGKVVIIDFGAVKQLSTQVLQVQGHTTRTIAIGSPGYMPSEQMAGKPRFCSDLYAVGMIVIQALTGMHPRDLPEDPTTYEVIWHDQTEVDPKLALILDKMVRYDFRQRYQSATAVLADLDQLESTTLTATLSDADLISENPTIVTPDTRIQILTHISGGSSETVSERGLDYSRLKELLSAQVWREADEETRRLMLKACDREVRLRPEDLRTFPCQDLHTINMLWMDHSNGLFGLSIQKEIWQSVGGKTDGSYETWEMFLKTRARWRVNSPWNRFGSRVGWCIKENWLSYGAMTFSLDAPKGHLPSWQIGSRSSSESAGGVMSALFSRMEVCKPYVPKPDITQKS